MSVLFKALAKASKAREAARPADGPTGRLSILSGGGARPSKKRLALLGGVLVIAVGAVAYMFLPEEPPARVANRPPPPILRVGPAAPSTPAPAQTTAPAPAAATPAAAPPEGVASAPAPAPAETPPVQAQAEPPAATPAPQPVLKPIIAAPKPASAPKPETSAPAHQPPKAAPPVIRPVEEDLPTLLARLRREKTESALGQPAKVARSAPQRSLLDEDGNPAIQVGASPQSAEDAARGAYEALLAGRYDEALAEYDHAIKSEKNSPSLQLGRAAALQKLGRTGEARAAYERVLALDPSNREALTNMTTLVAAQSPERALEDLRALRKANPGFSPIDAALGAQEAALGNLEAAREALGRAAAAAPDNGLYRLNLAIVQDRAGMTGDAAVSYRTALALLAGGEAQLPLSLDEVRRRLAYLEKR